MNPASPPPRPAGASARRALACLAVAAALCGLLCAPAWAHEGAALAKPTGLSAEASHDAVILTWDDPHDHSISGYVILRRDIARQASGEFTTIAADTGTAGTVYIDRTAEPATRYAYRVQARNAQGASPSSDAVEVETGPPAAQKSTSDAADGGKDEVRTRAVGRRPSGRDFRLTPNNADPTGIWCDDERMYVVDDADRRVYAYNIANGAHVGNLGFALDNDQTQARGVYADADTMWVVDGSDRIYAYTITDGASYGQRDASREFQAQTNGGYPSGIHSIYAKNLFFVVNLVDEQIYAYNTGRFNGMLGDRFELGDFDLIPHYAQPLGLWSDDASTIWVVDAERKHVFAYEIGGFGIGNGARLPAREIRLISQNSNPWGICSDGEVMWVADRLERKVFAYDLPPAPSGQITGVTFDELKEREATITVEIANPDSASKSVKLSYARDPFGRTMETDPRTITGTEVEFTLTGLSPAGTDYRLTAILGDESLATGGFRTWSKAATTRKHLKLSVVPGVQEDYPWLAKVYRQMRRVNTPVKALPDILAHMRTTCRGHGVNVLHATAGLHTCSVDVLAMGYEHLKNTDFFVHEMTHVGTMGTEFMAEDSEYVGMGWLYFEELANGHSDCLEHELYADAVLTLVRVWENSYYYGHCPETPDDASRATLAVARSVLAGEVPDWFKNEYRATGLAYDTSDDPKYGRMYDLEAVWRDLKRFPQRSGDNRVATTYALRHAFGGYCDRATAHHSAMHDGEVRNPWKAGGCVPQAPEAMVASSDSVAWEAPAYDGGAPVTKYVVEWRAADEEFHRSRSARITDLTDLSYQNDAIAAATTIRISAHNVHGRGEFATRCTPNTGDYWCGVITVGTHRTGTVTIGHGFGPRAGELTDNSGDQTFTIGSTRRTIDLLITGTGQFFAGWLYFRMTGGSALPDAVRDDLVLQVDGVAGAFSFSHAESSGAAYRWPSTLDWSGEDAVTLWLRPKPAPALFLAGTIGSGGSVLLWFDHSLDPAPADYTDTIKDALAGAFTVTVDGVEREITGIGQGAFDTTLLLQVASTIYQGQDVVVSYDRSAAGSSALTGTNDKKVESFTTGRDGVPAAGNSSTQVQPEARISVDTGAVAEGEAVAFTVSRRVVASEPLAVRLRLSESGSMLAVGEAGAKTVTIAANQMSVTLNVGTRGDTEWEAHSTVTATLTADGAYKIAAGEGSARKQVLDDDFPAAEAVLSAAPAEADEGAPFTATVTITTERNEPPHGDGGQMRVETADGSAKADLDYTALTPLTGTRGFSAADFGRVAVGGATRYQASKSVTITTINDTLREAAESFSVSLAKVSTGTAPAAGAIDLGASSATLTIRANDASDDAALSDLSLSAGALAPSFQSDTLNYTADVEYGTERITVTPSKRDPRAMLVYLTGDGSNLVDADTDAEGQQVDLVVGDNVIQIKLTAEDGVTTRTYRLTLTRAAPPSSDATLSALAVNDGNADLTLSPAFAPGTTSYAASVANSVATVTVSATANHASARVGIAPADAASGMTGHQVLLSEGTNEITVTVTAEDDSTQAYRVTVTRAEVENNDPVFAAGAMATRSLRENLGDATVSSAADLGAPFTATDDTDDTLAYALEGADAGHFTVNTSTGQLRTKAGVNYDHEAKSQHLVTVKVVDGFGGTDTIAVTVNVTDRDEPPVKPAAPRVSATPEGPNTLFVEWTAPGNAGRPPIETYDVRYRKGTSGGWTDGPGDVTQTRATITGLDEASTYQVRVRAANAEGDGPWSDAGTGSTLKEPVITGVAVTSRPGLEYDTYGAGEDIEITVTFNQAVAVTGDPVFEFCIGQDECETGSDPPSRRRAALTSGSGTRMLVFTYTVGSDDDPDQDASGIWIGDHTRTLKLDADDAIRSVATGNDAILDHDDLGTLIGHKVDGSRQGGIHTHPEFTHSHAHYSRGKGYYTQDYPDHTHPSHAHPDGSNSHPTGLRPGQHVHHEQEQPNSNVYVGPDLRKHDHFTHTHICRDIKPRCNSGDNFNSGRYGGILPREVTHSHADAEPGHGYTWPDLTANGNRPAEGSVYIGGVWRVEVGTTISADDPDGMRNATLRYQWLADYTEIRGATGSSYTVTAAEGGKTIGVQVSFTDDAGNEEVLRSRATLRVALANARASSFAQPSSFARTSSPARSNEETTTRAGPALTARFKGVPGEHDGERAFTLRIAFSEAIKVGYRTFRDHSVSVTGGTVMKARRVDKRQDLWEIEVEPASDEEVQIFLSPRACDETGAICTGDGRGLSYDIEDYVLGPATARYLIGTADDDTFSGQDGPDVLFGGLGADTISGGDGDDTLYGDDGDPEVTDPGEGDDLLDGEGGGDTLYGDAGDDTLYGGADDDTLDGGSGDDTLYGDAGTDTLTGGLGADTFVFAAGDGADTITDFTIGEADQIDLSAFAGLDGFASLTLTANGIDAVLDLRAHGGGTVRLSDVAVADLAAEDFLLP